MSNMYSDSSPCTSCMQKGSYSSLANTTSTSCLPSCLNRFNEGRSVKDKMYYDLFVLGKPVNIGPLEKPDIKKTCN